MKKTRRFLGGKKRGHRLGTPRVGTRPLDEETRLRLAHVILHDGKRLVQSTKLSWETLARALSGEWLLADTCERIESALEIVSGTSIERAIAQANGNLR